MIHTDLSPRLHHSSLAAAALAAAAAEGQSQNSIVPMPQSSFPQKTPFAIQVSTKSTFSVAEQISKTVLLLYSFYIPQA
jgi:hypothetical protein